MGNTNGSGQYIYVQASNSYWSAGYSGNMLDVMTVNGNTRHYYMQNCGTNMRMTRRSINSHGGNLTGYYNVGSGPGLVNMASVKGIDASRDLPGNDTAWFYILEGAPDYSVERLDYLTSAYSGQHGHAAAGTFLSGPGDGQDELNDPKDIASDADSHVYILDVYSTGEPVVKIYDSDLDYLGEVGDSVTISGTPLRLDVDEGDGEIHVAHTDGVSVFRPCEIPI